MARIRRSRALIGGALAVATIVMVTVAGAGLVSASHNDTETVHVCIGDSGKMRQATSCRERETAAVLLTEGALAAVRAEIASGAGADDARLDALEGSVGSLEGSVGALESTIATLQDAIDALEAAAAADDATIAALTERIEQLEADVAALEAATTAAEVTFTKIHDGGHYASYNVTGSGFQPGSTVTTGVGTTATVTDDGTFSVFGGNLFCDRLVTVSGTAADGSAVTRSAPVECDSESGSESPATVTFTKIHDGGHYASYEVSGTGFQPGSTVTTGVGTTATVAGDGTFSVFGGNLFCDREVSVSGTDASGNHITRSAPVECNSEA